MARSALYFITGGVRSGKSRFAEQMARKWVETYGGSLHYLACSRVFDEEMAEAGFAPSARSRGKSDSMENMGVFNRY